MFLVTHITKQTATTDRLYAARHCRITSTFIQAVRGLQDHGHQRGAGLRHGSPVSAPGAAPSRHSQVAPPGPAPLSPPTPSPPGRPSRARARAGRERLREPPPAPRGSSQAGRAVRTRSSARGRKRRPARLRKRRFRQAPPYFNMAT